MFVTLGNTIYIDFITSDSTGAAVDADALPTFEVFKDADDTALVLTGTAIAKRTGKTGNYRITLPCTTANSFVQDACYNVVVSATVSAVNGKGVVSTFQIKYDPSAALTAYDPPTYTEMIAMEARLTTRISNVAAGGAIDISTEYDALSFVPRTVVAGDNVVINLQLLQDGSAVDITDFGFYYGVKDDIGDTAYKIGAITGVITDASAGKFAFTLSALHTSIAAFTGVEEYIKVDSNGNKTTLTPPAGVKFILKERIVYVPAP